jgi:hypothetical protein
VHSSHRVLSRRPKEFECLGKGFVPQITSFDSLLKKLEMRKAQWQSRTDDSEPPRRSVVADIDLDAVLNTTFAAAAAVAANEECGIVDGYREQHPFDDLIVEDRTDENLESSGAFCAVSKDF